MGDEEDNTNSNFFPYPVKVFFVATRSENGPFIGEDEMREKAATIVAYTCACKEHLFLRDDRYLYRLR